MNLHQPTICIVTDEIHPITKGGIGRLVAEAATELLAAGFSVHLLLDVPARAVLRYRDYAHDHLRGAQVHAVDELLTADLDPPADIPLWAFHFLPYYRSYRIALALQKLIARSKLDLVEFADHLGLGYVTLKWRRLWGESFQNTRLVVRLHGSYELWIKADQAQKHSRQELQTFQMEHYCLHQADGWLSPSSAVADWYQAAYGIPAKSVAVSTPAFQRLGPGNHHSRRLQRPLEVLFYGKLQHLKGPDLFIKAALRASETLSEPVRFHLVGHDVREAFGPSYRAQLQALIPNGQRDRFVFHGRIAAEQLPGLAERCALAVVPSRVETFCLAAHELNWIGIPLVLRDLPAFRDFFHDSIDCRIFGGDDSEAVGELADVLIDVLTHPSPFEGWEWNARQIVASQRLAETYHEALAWHLAVADADRLGTTPTVSVIIPYFNSQKTIDETVRSVLASTLPPDEIVVIDDGSTDSDAVATFESLRTRFTGDPRFKFVHKANGGLSSARNAGLAVITGTYVLPLDADDLIEPSYLELAVKALERNPELAAVSCFAGFFADGQPADRVIDYVIAYDLDPLLITLENRAGVAGSVFRRSMLPSGGYCESLPAYEDWDLWWTLAEAGARAEVLPRVLYRYRRRSDGLYAQVNESKHADLVARIESRHSGLLAVVAPDRKPGLTRLLAEKGWFFTFRRRLRDLYHRLR